MANQKIVFNSDSMKGFNNLVLFRIAPHYIKRVFYQYDPNALGNLISSSDIQPYIANDEKFYSDLKKGLIYRDDRNCFRFYSI